MNRSRRAFLSAMATFGLAGCAMVGIGENPPEQTENGTTTPPNGTGNDPPTTQTDRKESYVHAGPTIPSYPHAPSEAPSLADVDHSLAISVLTADDVTDYGDVDYVADPFLFVEEGTWHMFFEVYNSDLNPDAVIGHATSPDGLDWSYQRVVLAKNEHTSFPLVWKWKGSYYMSPPTGTDVELWKAKSDLRVWRNLGNAIDVDYYSHDPSFVWYDDRWWLFTDRGSENVMVYHADELGTDGWTPHAQNPVVTGRPQAARQAGRPIVHGERLLVPFMDNEAHYGHRVRLFEVTDLSPDSYADRELEGSPILEPFGNGWAAEGMHAFDAWWRGPGKGWRCAVDGQNDDIYTIGIADVPP